MSSGTVPPSNYTIDFGTFSLEKDRNDVVRSESGYAQLVAGSTTGQDYAIHHGALTGASTLAEVESARQDAATTGLISTLSTLQLPATWFDLVGLHLDTTTDRTVIIRNTDQGVSSYQLLVVKFD